MRKLLLILIATTAISTAWADNASNEANPAYTVLSKNAAKLDSNGKVNVKEFFSFECVFCQRAEAAVESDLTNNSEINLERVHVTWDDKTAKLAYLALLYKKYHLERLYEPTFKVMVPLEVSPELGLTESKTLFKFLVKNNVNKAQAVALLNDYQKSQNDFREVMLFNKNKNDTLALMDAYGIKGTPTFVVANKYVLKPASPKEDMRVILALVAQIKAQAISATPSANIDHKSSQVKAKPIEKSKVPLKAKAKKKVKNNHNKNKPV